MTTSAPTAPALPAGYTARPLSMADAEAVFAVHAAQEALDLGHVAVELADIVGDWQRPSFDVEGSTVGVVHDGALVAVAELYADERGNAAVHPDHRGRGIGTWLAHWMQAGARERGWLRIGMAVVEDGPGDRLLTSLGHHVRWTSWVLQLPPGAEIPARPLPDGYVVRAAEPSEHRALHAVIDAAFLEWSVRDPEPFEDFEAEKLQRPGFEPWHLRVVVDPTGEVVGGACLSMWDKPGRDEVETYISRLAVRADQRNRGLAQALMVDAFAAGRAHGATTAGLDTDSRTGALGLYEKVGMRVTSTWVHRAAYLPPAGLTARPLTADDATAVHALIVAEEVADAGRADTDLDDVLAEWQLPDRDLSTTTIGLFGDGRLVAYGELTDGHGFAAVEPDRRGQGVGRWIAGWLESTARSLRWRTLAAQVMADRPGDHLLQHRGYAVRWTSWDLELPEGATIPERPLPDGYAVRLATPADHEACWTVFEDAFLEWSDRERRPLAEFGGLMWERPGFAPWNLQVVTDPAGAVVGAVFVTLTDDGDAYIHKLAVRRDQRGRGLAQVLLGVAFDAARAHGARISRLSTDTRAGARSLYEHMGMAVASTWVNRALTLG